METNFDKTLENVNTETPNDHDQPANVTQNELVNEKDLSINQCVIKNDEVLEENKNDTKQKEGSENIESTTLTNLPDEPTEIGVDSADIPIDFEKTLKNALLQFNSEPKKARSLLISSQLVKDTPQDFARFLIHTQGLSKRKMGEFFGSSDPFSQEVYIEFLKLHSFEELSLDSAIRLLMKKFRLPGEAQQIDRIVEKFATRYFETNQSAFSSEDTVYVLAFSIIMLNTDLHSSSIPSNQKMTLEGFINNNRGIDQGNDLSRAYLTDIYERVKTEEIRMNDEDMFESQTITFIAPAKSGWLEKMSQKMFHQWKKHWFVLNDGCLYYFNSPGDEFPRCIIPLVDVRIGRGTSLKEIVVAKNDNSPIKSIKKIQNGKTKQVNYPQFVLRALNKMDRESWLSVLQQQIASSHRTMSSRSLDTFTNFRQTSFFGHSIPERFDFPPPDIEGWMKKRGEINPSWRRRYFCMFVDHKNNIKGLIFYFVSWEQARRMIDLGENTAKGVINLNEVYGVNMTQDKMNGKFESVIELCTSGRSWFVCPESEADFTKWFQRITELTRDQLRDAYGSQQQMADLFEREETKSL